MHNKFGLEILKKYRLEYLGTDGQKMLKYILEIRQETVNRIHFFRMGTTGVKWLGGTCD
jgi:hypothetical protein